jgi:hypothetical protein
LKERLRVDIAERAGCAYCATSGVPYPVDDDLAEGLEDPGSRAAVAFAHRLASTPWEVSSAEILGLRDWWPEAAVIELLMFCAWQVGGPRVLRSWGADRWKSNGVIDLERLPVVMPYAAEAGEPNLAVAMPAPPSAADVADLLAEASATGSAPITWLQLLAPRPDLLMAWHGLYKATVHGRSLGPRIGMLIRRDLARLLVMPAWAPVNAPALADVAPDRIPEAALISLDASVLESAERAALGYARAVVVDGDADAELLEVIEQRLRPDQRVELGFAVAVQLGALLVTRALASPAQTTGPRIEILS